MILLTGLMFASFGQSQNATQQKSADYIAIENQSGIQVVYVNSDAKDAFTIKFTNTSSKSVTLAYAVFSNVTSAELFHAKKDITLKPGETLSSAKYHEFVTLSKGEKFEDYVVTLTIK